MPKIRASFCVVGVPLCLLDHAFVRKRIDVACREPRFTFAANLATSRYSPRSAASLDRRPHSSSKKAERLSCVGCYMPGGLVADCPLGCGFARRAVPKFGFCCLQAATSCGSICGKGLTPCTPCGVPTMIGRMQSTTIPAPLLAPWGTKPACLHAAAICAHAPPFFGAGCAGAAGVGGAGCANVGLNSPRRKRLVSASGMVVTRMMLGRQATVGGALPPE